MSADDVELLTLWRLRSRPEIHIEDGPTPTGVIALCGFQIPSSANALSSRQPVSRVRCALTAPMCLSCRTLLDHHRKTNPNQI